MTTDNGAFGRTLWEIRAEDAPQPQFRTREALQAIEELAELDDMTGSFNAAHHAMAG